jgi:ABC-type bacteriocin/lantibiotic exporter with double-glycine peptidase domain
MSDQTVSNPQGGEYNIDIIKGQNVVVGDNAAINQYGLSLEEVAKLAIELKNQEQPKVWNGRFPYKGLRAFQQRHAEFFFGREALVAQLIERVQRASFIAIAGPSGSGKSSSEPLCLATDRL